MGGGVVFRGEVCESEGEKGGCRRGEEGAAEGGRGRVAAEGEISEAKRGPEGGGNVFEKGCVDYENFPLCRERGLASRGRKSSRGEGNAPRRN